MFVYTDVEGSVDRNESVSDIGSVRRMKPNVNICSWVLGRGPGLSRTVRTAEETSVKPINLGVMNTPLI